MLDADACEKCGQIGHIVWKVVQSNGLPLLDATTDQLVKTIDCVYCKLPPKGKQLYTEIQELTKLVIAGEISWRPLLDEKNYQMRRRYGRALSSRTR